MEIWYQVLLDMNVLYMNGIYKYKCLNWIWVSKEMLLFLLSCFRHKKSMDVLNSKMRIFTYSYVSCKVNVRGYHKCVCLRTFFDELGLKSRDIPFHFRREASFKFVFMYECGLKRNLSIWSVTSFFFDNEGESFKIVLLGLKCLFEMYWGFSQESSHITNAWKCKATAVKKQQLDLNAIFKFSNIL